MIERLLAELWSDARTASPDRLVAVGVVIGAAVVTAAIAGVTHPMVLLAVVVLAVMAAIQPAGNAMLGVVAIVIVRWLATNDDPTGPLVLAVAAGLLVMHLVLALMASTPHSFALERTVLARWGRRGAAIAASTVAVWALAALLDRRDAGGSTVLAVSALLLLGGAALAIRRRALDG